MRDCINLVASVITFVLMAVGEGEGLVVGIGEGIGVGELLAIGTAKAFPLFQINFLPLFVHVYLIPDEVMV